MITLTTPMTSTTSTVGVVAMILRFGTADSQTQALITYAPCDSNGNILPTAEQTTVTLTGADIAVFMQTAGTPRVRAQAALQNNVSALAGQST